MEQKYLAVDMGSSNVKIVSGYLDEKKKLVMCEAGRFPTPHVWMNGHICTDIYGVYREVCKVLSRLGREGTVIKSLGADSWSSDFGLVTPEGRLLGLPVFYRDKWTEGMPEEVEKVISYHDLYPLTTQRRIRDAALCQLLAIKKECPTLLKNGNRMMYLGDLLMYFFTGRVCSEVSVASYSQLFSMKNMDWENRVFDMFALSRSLQPEVVQAGEVLGKISQEQAGQLGINQFSVIAPAVHDTSSAGVAVPAEDQEGWAYLATGSWYLVSMELDEPADFELSYKFNLSNTGLAFGKTLLKRNVCAMWLIQECRRIWSQKRTECEYSMIASLAGRARPFAAMIDPDDNCFYNPVDMVEAVREYLRQSGQIVPEKEDIGQIARIIYESIAFKCRYSLEALKKTTGRQVRTVYAVGGASGVEFLNQMLSSALGLPLVTGPQEASVAGNILLQAVGTGELHSEEEVKDVVRRTFPSSTYYPQDTQLWERHYPAFLQICGLEPV